MTGSAYSAFKHLRVSLDEGIGVVTLAPVADDDLEASYFANLRDVWNALARDQDVRAVVLASRAETFNPRQPAANMATLTGAPLYDRAVRLLTVQQFAVQMLTFRKPVVAAVNGPAYGLGAQLALFADSAIATPAVVFGDTHVGHGLAAGDGGTMMWPLLVGVPLARRLVIQGHTISAEEALALNLVEEIVESDALMETSTRVANRLADLPQLPFMSSKVAMNNLLRLSALVAWDPAAAYEAAGLEALRS